MKGHFHSDAVHFGITAIGVAATFWVFRIIAGKLATSDNATVSNIGKATGGFFSFPAGS